MKFKFRLFVIFATFSSATSQTRLFEAHGPYEYYFHRNQPALGYSQALSKCNQLKSNLLEIPSKRINDFVEIRTRRKDFKGNFRKFAIFLTHRLILLILVCA